MLTKELWNNRACKKIFWTLYVCGQEEITRGLISIFYTFAKWVKWLSSRERSSCEPRTGKEHQECQKMSYALGRAACLETGSEKRKFIIMRRQDEGRREEKLRFVMAELNITRKSCSLIKEKSIEITFRTGKSSKSTKLILLSFDHKQKTWKMPLRLLLRTVQYVELGAAADQMHFVALRELRAVRLDSRRRKCSQEDKRRFSCAKSIRTSKLALMRSRTKEVHTWNKQNSFETLTHRSPFILFWPLMSAESSTESFCW